MAPVPHSRSAVGKGRGQTPLGFHSSCFAPVFWGCPGTPRAELPSPACLGDSGGTQPRSEEGWPCWEQGKWCRASVSPAGGGAVGFRSSCNPQLEQLGHAAPREGTNTPQGDLPPKKPSSGEASSVGSVPCPPAAPRGCDQHWLHHLALGKAQGTRRWNRWGWVRTQHRHLQGRWMESPRGGEPQQPPKPGAGAPGAAVSGCLGRRAGSGLTLCCSGGPSWSPAGNGQSISKQLLNTPASFHPPLHPPNSPGRDETRRRRVTMKWPRELGTWREGRGRLARHAVP